MQLHAHPEQHEPQVTTVRLAPASPRVLGLLARLAGLAKNIELNLGNYTPAVVAQVQDWFNELWDDAAEYDLAAVFSARFEAHPPELIYLRMLWERYGDELTAEAEASGQPKIHLTGFQRDGLWRARRILEDHNGVLVADEVGLGKTFLVGELIREAALERRQRVLVVAPPHCGMGRGEPFGQPKTFHSRSARSMIWLGTLGSILREERVESSMRTSTTTRWSSLTKPIICETRRRSVPMPSDGYSLDRRPSPSYC